MVDNEEILILFLHFDFVSCHLFFFLIFIWSYLHRVVGDGLVDNGEDRCEVVNVDQRLRSELDLGIQLWSYSFASIC